MTYEEFLNTDISISYGGEDLGTVKGRDFAQNLEWRITQYLAENHVYVDVYRDRFGFYICIDIDGDWKHDHGYVDYVMRQVFGYELHHEDITEEDGSDWYASTHYYVTKDMMEAIKKFNG